jgi:hypothetical protein
MATPRYTVQVRLKRVNGVPADDIVNVWHFEGDDNATDDDTRWSELVDGLHSRLSTFYGAIDGGFSQLLSGQAEAIYINPRDPKPRYPRETRPFTFSPSTGARLPGEVALCLSFEGARESGANMRRRRGRIYLGPLAQVVVGPDALGGDARPTTAYVTTILDAAQIMAVGTDGAARLAIFSPTEQGDGPSADAAWNDAVRLWVDDAFDTQRRRGANATTRTIRTVGA